MSGNNFNFDYDLPDFQFDPTEIPDTQLDHIKTEINNREEIISNLRKQVIETETHREQLQSAVDQLRAQNSTLQEKVQTLQSERSTSRPQEVFTNLGQAVKDAESELANSQYRLENFEVQMKANVIQDEEGVKFHLPGVDEDFAAENLSTVNFRLRSNGEASEPEGPDATFDPIPDLRGMGVERARTVIQREGFSVGTVEPESEAGSGVVVDQFPSPRSIAEPGTKIDLTVSWDQREERSDTDSSDGSETTDEMDSTHDSLESELPDLEEIDGIGPTYAKRLRSGGVESILDLSETDPETAADLAHTSPSRSKGWIEEATLIVRDITR